MGEKLVVGPFEKGLRTDRPAFMIDNDNFPVLQNAYQWRGRVKRKRGTSILGRLKRAFNSTQSNLSPFFSQTQLDAGGNGNIITSFLVVNGSLQIGSVTITTAGFVTYTDPTQTGVLVGSDATTGTINYITGDITIPSKALQFISVVYNYYPQLPVMGLEDLFINSTQFPGTIAFDTKYSYNIKTTAPVDIYDVSFYKNPSSVTVPIGVDPYVQKPLDTTLKWNGEDYQQFWSENYQGALWVTNGVAVPFDVNKVGMQFKLIIDGLVISTTRVRLAILGHGLVVGDFIFVNEVVGVTGINFQTGYVVLINDVNNVEVVFPNATIAGAFAPNKGIAQYLTNTAIPTVDCIRWYDGDPTTTDNGWVNFMPPLSQFAYSIADLPAAQYYLVGAKLIKQFKDRLVFFGPVVQTSVLNALPIYLEDTIVYSQNGTPYYTTSYTNSPNPAIDTPTSITNIFFPMLLPINQTATSPAWFEDQVGFGGFVNSGLDQTITSVAPNKDVLIVGFTGIETRLVYSGNDVVPFNFYIINSELGTSSSFSTIVMDNGVLTRGARGFILTMQVGAERFDLDIPDEVFTINLSTNGAERFCAQRDYINEWIYFTYPVSNDPYSIKFPNTTLQYNYRDNSFGIFYENYTTYGSFREASGETWGDLDYFTWGDWDEPWNAGDDTILQPKVIAGNQQGFVIYRDQGLNEANSLYIQNIVGSTITCPDHCLDTGQDYIIISGVLGTVGPFINNKIFSIVVIDKDNFTLNPSLLGSGTYLGGGLIKRMYVPLIQTKQFPVAWEMGRKTRIGVQQYLLSTSSNAQLTLYIFLSQDGANPYNQGPIVPNPLTVNPSLIYSTILYTCPESTNLGLTPFNTNLQMPIASAQAQIWHRINTSLIGDTVQLGFTLDETQMRTVDDAGNPISQFSEIELFGFIIDLSPSMLLC